MANSQIERGQEWLGKLLKLAGVSAAVTGKKVIDTLEDGESFWLTIDERDLTPEQIQELIGVNGAVLDALQYLANSTLNLNQPPEQQGSYTIELDGYRLKRQTEIRAIAQSAMEQVRTTGQRVEIKSLSSSERRLVHQFLKEYPDLETFSQGKEPNRQLIVRIASESVGESDY